MNLSSSEPDNSLYSSRMRLVASFMLTNQLSYQNTSTAVFPCDLFQVGIICYENVPSSYGSIRDQGILNIVGLSVLVV